MTDQQREAWREAAEDEGRYPVTVVGGAVPDDPRPKLLVAFVLDSVIGLLVAGGAMLIHTTVTLDRGWQVFLAAFAVVFVSVAVGQLALGSLRPHATR
jgi:hypothetical protein